MKKTKLILLLLLIANTLMAQETVKLNKWIVTKPEKINTPAFSEIKNIENNSFKESDLLSKTRINLSDHKKGEIKETGKDSILLKNIEKKNLLVLNSYLNVDQWTKATIHISSNTYYELFLDNQSIETNNQPGLTNSKTRVKLTTGKHNLTIKTITKESNLKLDAYIETEEGFNNSVTTNLSPVRNYTIDDVFAGKRISSASISPTGKYALIHYRETAFGSGKNKSHSEIYNLKENKSIWVLRNKKISNINWLPKTDRISYISAFEEKSEIFIYDFVEQKETSVAKDIKNISGYTWSPNEDYIIFSDYIQGEKPGNLKKIYGSEDRLPYYRDRTFLHKIDIKTGIISLLTTGNLSTSLHDIKPDGSKILFSTEKVDYSTIPFKKQNLYELNIVNNKISTIWENKTYEGSCQYSPDGNKLLVLGGPECFGNIGVNISNGKAPSNFDIQMYIYDLETKKATPISKKFKPSIDRAYWGKDNNIYAVVTDLDYRNIYKYNTKTQNYFKININVDVLSNISFDYNYKTALYTGVKISTPLKLYAINLKKEENKLVSFPQKENFANIKFGETEDWNFINKNGTTIYGRIYYPVNYDKTKKYPLIVNYYGGTSPVSRGFGGRYPANTWAANGYMVYLLQPSGATGFGQDFSALHVNGWGFDAIDDIIDGTKKFLEAHPSADAENVGCIGASYGGYTTMLLQTRTDIFKTGISHAGISSLTSYWGEGYWGYSYSAVATKGSYPWNRKDIYIENSPVYNADKFQNSILLLHGTDDTNVPVGESKQFYAALNLLGKDVEMVLVDGQDHWILDYKKRIQWHHTIISWFDKKLKNQPQHWNDMYPEKNL